MPLKRLMRHLAVLYYAIPIIAKKTKSSLYFTINNRGGTLRSTAPHVMLPIFEITQRVYVRI